MASGSGLQIGGMGVGTTVGALVAVGGTAVGAWVAVGAGGCVATGAGGWVATGAAVGAAAGLQAVKIMTAATRMDTSKYVFFISYSPVVK
jgi:hypothetical protein